jgi:hypothetical protein
MTRLTVAFAAIAALLFLPSVAAAKELSAATICGASGCRTVEHPPMALASGGDGVEDAVPPVSPYYRVTLHVEHEGTDESWDVFWIPNATTLGFRDEAGNATFERLSLEAMSQYRDEPRDAEALAAWATVTEGVEPFEMPKVTEATVGGKPVDDPGSYLGLFGREPDPSLYPDASDWMSVELKAATPSPWTDAVLITVSPGKRIIQVGTTSFAHLDADEASAIAAGASLGPEAAAGLRWAVLAAALALALGLVAALVLLLRTMRRLREGGGVAVVKRS